MFLLVVRRTHSIKLTIYLVLVSTGTPLSTTPSDRSAGDDSAVTRNARLSRTFHSPGLSADLAAKVKCEEACIHIQFSIRQQKFTYVDLQSKLHKQTACNLSHRQIMQRIMQRNRIGYYGSPSAFVLAGFRDQAVPGFLPDLFSSFIDCYSSKATIVLFVLYIRR